MHKTSPPSDAKRPKQCLHTWGSRCHPSPVSCAPAFFLGKAEHCGCAPLACFSPFFPSPTRECPLTSTIPHLQASQTKHRPGHGIPQNLDHQFQTGSREITPHSPHIATNQNLHSTSIQRRMPNRELPLGIRTPNPLVLAILAAHTHIAANQPQVRPVTPTAHRHAAQSTKAHVTSTRMLSTQSTLPTPGSTLPTTSVLIGLPPHASTRSNLQRRNQLVTAKHRLARKHIKLKVLDRHKSPNNFNARIIARPTVTTPSKAGKSGKP